MTLPNIDETNHTELNYMMCVIGDSFTRFPSQLVSSVDFATSAAPIPFGIAPIEGLVINQEGACLQFDAGALCGTKAESPKYSVNIQTSKGIVNLLVDSVSKGSSDKPHDHKTEILCLNAIEDFIKNCESPIDKIKPKDQLSTSIKTSKSIALCRIDHRVIGLYSDHISFFEHPVKLHPVRTKHQFSYLVELENGELLNGIDLSALLGLAPSPSIDTKKWAIGIQTEGDRFALVTEQLIGLEEHEIDSFQRLNNSANESCWLKHEQHGPVEILNPKVLIKEKSASIEHDDFPRAASTKQSSIPSNTTQGIGIKCNAFDLVLPSAAVESVGGVIKLSSLKNKPSKNTIPAYDISKLFSDQTDIQKNNKRLITIKSLSKKNFALLVPDVYKPKTDNTWSIPSILPKPLGKLIKSTQIVNGRCELLIRDEFISELNAPEFDKFKKDSFCGWFTPL